MEKKNMLILERDTQNLYIQLKWLTVEYELF